MPPSRSRSRSPRPSHKSSRGGFRWKEKPRHNDDEPTTSSRPSDRSYRDRRDDDSRRSGRDYERSRDEETRHSGRDHERSRDEGRSERRREDGENADVTKKPNPTSTVDDDIASKFGPGAGASSKTGSTTSKSAPKPATTSSPAAPKPRAKAVPTGPMIVVKINDRLGTTTKVPCLPSDSIGDLKKLVAMRIGRKPHEIMLKRQSERPFKDFLTLEDYGVGDGVQLDLELDTGD